MTWSFMKTFGLRNKWPLKRNNTQKNMQVLCCKLPSAISVSDRCRIQSWTWWTLLISLLFVLHEARQTPWWQPSQQRGHFRKLSIVRKNAILTQLRCFKISHRLCETRRARGTVNKGDRQRSLPLLLPLDRQRSSAQPHTLQYHLSSHTQLSWTMTVSTDWHTHLIKQHCEIF